MVHRDRRRGQRRVDGGGVAGVGVDHHHLDPGPERRRAGGQPRLHRSAGPPVDLPQQGLVASDVDEPGLPRIRALPSNSPVVVVPVGQPPRPTEPGLVHPQHPNRVGLGELDRAAGDDRPLHRRPRHPMRSGDFGLVPTVLHRPCQCPRSRVVVRIPAGTWATCSVNDRRGHAAVRHRQRRLRHCT